MRIARTLRDQIPAGADVELFSSDLLRTSQTADEVAREFGVEPILDPRLREKSYGEAEDPGAGLRAPDHRDPRLRTLREDDFYHNRRIISLGDLRHLDDWLGPPTPAARGAPCTPVGDATGRSGISRTSR